MLAANATDHVLDAVRTAILTGDLAAGETLRQEELAERLGVSRMPVREAIKRLHAEGLVEVLPSRRVRVAALSRDEIEDIYDMRAALEPLAVRLAVPRLTRAQLRDAAHALEAAADEEDAETFGVRNAAFHLSLMSACERPRLLAEIASLLDLSDRYQRAALRAGRAQRARARRARRAAGRRARRATRGDRGAADRAARARAPGARLLEFFDHEAGSPASRGCGRSSGSAPRSSGGRPAAARERGRDAAAVGGARGARGAARVAGPRRRARCSACSGCCSCPPASG